MFPNVLFPAGSLPKFAYICPSFIRAKCVANQTAPHLLTLNVTQKTRTAHHEHVHCCRGYLPPAVVRRDPLEAPGSLARAPLVYEPARALWQQPVVRDDQQHRSRHVQQEVAPLAGQQRQPGKRRTSQAVEDTAYVQAQSAHVRSHVLHHCDRIQAGSSVGEGLTAGRHTATLVFLCGGGQEMGVYSLT